MIITSRLVCISSIYGFWLPLWYLPTILALIPMVPHIQPVIYLLQYVRTRNVVILLFNKKIMGYMNSSNNIKCNIITSGSTLEWVLIRFVFIWYCTLIVSYFVWNVILSFHCSLVSLLFNTVCRHVGKHSDCDRL